MKYPYEELIDIFKNMSSDRKDRFRVFLFEQVYECDFPLWEFTDEETMGGGDIEYLMDFINGELK